MEGLPEIRQKYRKFCRKKPEKQRTFEEKQMVYEEIRTETKRHRKESLAMDVRIMEELRLPADMKRYNPIITMCGKRRIVVENYKRLIEYGETTIRILTGIGTVRILGEQMRIVFYTEDTLKIVGEILSVEVVS